MEKVQTNPTKVIREKCFDCCCGSWYEVEQCTAVRCPLHPWRMGKNPYRKPQSEAQKEARLKNLEKMRQKRSSPGNGPKELGD